MKISIIDPSSTEFNRGSFCYTPYLLYNGLKEGNNDVIINESFISEDLDKLKKADIFIVCLWSYPQIEAAILLNKFIPFKFNSSCVYFAGYYPLINMLGLPILEPDFLLDKLFMKLAMKAYPKYYNHFKRLLLSDCDMHLKKIEKGHKVYPMFTTYGCPYGCSFCPSSKNCNRTRIILNLSDVFFMLDNCLLQNIRYIHFTDEDMFFNIDRLYQILSYLKGKNFHLIALGSAEKVLQFVKKYGSDIFKEAGLEVIEIGFESVASSDMGAGKSIEACEELANMNLSVSIFWLVLTFYPGETIQTLNKTGAFMKKHGFDSDEVVGRLVTNGTVGGLGQYFQPYHGLDLYDKLESEGLFLTTRPIRLIPSYVPNSFLDSVITEIKLENKELFYNWAKFYKLNFSLEMLELGRSIRSYIADKPVVSQINLVIYFALLARMEVIK